MRYGRLCQRRGWRRSVCWRRGQRHPAGSGRYDRAADRDDEHITKRPSALRAFKEGGTRNTTTRHGAHTGSCTECRRLCVLRCKKPCSIGEGQPSFRERKDTCKVCRRGGGDARGEGRGRKRVKP